MRQSIRALGWATRILWIAAGVFIVTSLYSPLKLVLERQIEIGSPQVSLTDGTMAVSLPFFVNNTGFYDISDLNISTSVADYRGVVISVSKTFVQNIPRGGSVNKTHTMSVSLTDIMSKNLTHLLFNDTRLNLNASVGLSLAHVIPLRVSTMMNMSWGGPLCNLSIGGMDFPEWHNSTHYATAVWLSFDNHSPFDLVGVMRLEMFKESGEYFGLGIKEVNVPSGRKFSEEVIIYVPSGDLGKFTETGKVHVFFESPMGSLEWWCTYGS